MKDVILRGDAKECAKKLDDQSVDMVMTSPPYWALRKYFNYVKFKDNIPEKEKERIIKELKKNGIKPQII